MAALANQAKRLSSADFQTEKRDRSSWKIQDTAEEAIRGDEAEGNEATQEP